MPDPLTLLTFVAVIGLVAWVVLALVRPIDPPTAPPRAVADAPLPDKSPPPRIEKPEERVTPPPGPTAVTPTAPAPKVQSIAPDEPTGPNALILVTAVGRTDPGLRRTRNEDAYTILEDQHLFLIADGMGKHAAGEVASQLCVEAITEAFRAEAPPPVADDLESKLPPRAARLRAAILSANARVLAAAEENDAYRGMGTTVVSAYFAPQKQRVYVAHVGDSRCYRLRGGELRQLTADHTLGAAGIAGKTSALLSRAVGVEQYVDVDVLIESPSPGDFYLLCSDGLSRMVDDALIQSTLESVADLDEVLRFLIAKANEKGGRDNITAILVRVDRPSGLPTAGSPAP